MESTSQAASIFGNPIVIQSVYGFVFSAAEELNFKVNWGIFSLTKRILCIYGNTFAI
jgi:hypothetical protein